MKAAIYKGINQLEIGNWEKPSVGENEILIKVEACAVCGSDIRIFHHGNNRVKPPQILGHEMSGVIVEKGVNVRDFQIGDRLAVGADVPCGHCKACEAGVGNNCEENYAMGYQFAGGFAEYCLLNETVVNYGPVHRIPDNISFEEAALAEPLACVINGMELVNAKLGDTMVIIGAGPIGCMMIPVAKFFGVTRIIIIDKDIRRIENAEKFHADYYICNRDVDSVSEVLKITQGVGADVIITANAVSATHIEAMKMAAHRARINLFGGLAENTEITIQPNWIHYKELTVTGSHGSTPRQHRMAIELIASGKVDVKDFISHRFSLDEIGKAFAAAENHDGMRVIVKP